MTDETAMLHVIQEWYREKPSPRRVISRTVLESLLPGPHSKKSRIAMTRFCNSRFETYGTESHCRLWVVTPEALT